MALFKRHGGMDMPMGHDSHGAAQSDMMPMSDMMMVFFTSTTTPLYSESWAPETTGQYAGACIFLITLSVMLRCLFALRCNFSTLWQAWTRRQGTVMLRYETEDEYAKMRRRPWRINEAATRAILDTVLVGVSYLL
jgi:solute carrier family 31 (copper transporter), member 1